MKKMSEVFELPVSVLDIGYCIHSIDDAEIYAAHAINNVDALADALSNILTDYNRHTAIYPVDMTDDHCANLHNLMVSAAAALAAYRGEK